MLSKFCLLSAVGMGMGTLKELPHTCVEKLGKSTRVQVDSSQKLCGW